MKSSKAVLIVIALALGVVAFVVLQRPELNPLTKGTPQTYSLLRSQADQLILDGSFLDALNLEEKALNLAAKVDAKQVSLAREQSLLRLADFSMANGNFKTSRSYRDQLISHYEGQEDPEQFVHEIRLQRKMCQLCEQTETLELDGLEATTAACALFSQTEILLKLEQPYKAVLKLEEGLTKLNAVLGEENLVSNLKTSQLYQLKARYEGCVFTEEIGCATTNVETETGAKTLWSSLENHLGNQHPKLLKLLDVEAEACKFAGSWWRYTQLQEKRLALLGTEISKDADSKTQISDTGLVADFRGRDLLVATVLMRIAFGKSRNLQFKEADLFFAESKKRLKALEGVELQQAEWAFLKSDNFTSRRKWVEGADVLEEEIQMLREIESSHSANWDEPNLNRIRRLLANTIHRHALCKLWSSRDTLDQYRVKVALDAFAESKDILERLGLTKTLRYVFVNRDLAYVNALSKSELGEDVKYETARNFMDRAIETYQEMYGQHSQSSENEIAPETGERAVGYYHRHLQSYAIGLERAWQNYEESEKEYFRAVNGQPQNGMGSQIAMCLRELGLTYYEWNKNETAVNTYAKAIDLYGEQFFAGFIASNSDTTSLAGYPLDCLSDMVAATDLKDEVQIAKTFEYVSRLKGIVVRSKTLNSQLDVKLNKLDESEQNRVREEWGTNARKIFGLLLKKSKEKKSSENLIQELEKLTNEKQALLTKLNQLVPSKNLAFESDILEQLNIQLPEKTALIEIFLQSANKLINEDNYFAFVFQRQTGGKFTLELMRLGTADSIDRAIAELNESLDPSMRESGERLREITWDLIQPKISGAECVVVCGDGDLLNIPWAGLPMKGSDKECLVHNFRIVNAGNARELVENLSATRVPGSDVLLVGDIDYGGDAAKSNFPALPNSKLEIDGIGSHFEQTSILRGLEVTPDAIQKRLSTARIAHFATHGFILNSNDRDSEKEHPFAFSTLALSIANEKETGFLPASNIIMKNFNQLELVVLSACRSTEGVSDTAAAGTYGMQRAMILAGAQTCIASRWEVLDKDAAEYMELFYENLVSKKQSKIEAMQNAQIEMSNLGYPPRSWACWQLMGDWR